MKTRIKAFVQAYKAILQIQQQTPIDKPSWFVLIPMVLLVGAIATLMAFALQVQTNLNYVWYVTNTVVLGSFLMYRIRQELQYKGQYKFTYNHWILIGMNGLTLATILFLSNAVIILLLFRTIMPVFDLFFIAIIALLLGGIHTMITQTTPMHHYVPKVLKYVVLIVPLYVILLNLLSGVSVGVGYIIATSLLAILAIVEHKIPKNLIPTNVISTVLLILGSLWGVVYVIDEDGFQNPIEDVYNSTPNIDETIEFVVDTPGILYTTNNYYINRGNHYNEYDLHFEYEKRISNTEQYPFSIELDALSYSIVTDEDTYQEVLYVYQTYDDQFITMPYTDSCYFPSDFFMFERTLSLVCGDSIHKFEDNPLFQDATITRIREFDKDMIVYEDESKVVLYLGGIVYIDASGSRQVDQNTYYYDGGYLMVESNNEYIVYRLRDYMYDKDPLFTYSGSYGTVDKMHVIEDKFYLTTTNDDQDNILVLNESGRIASIYYDYQGGIVFSHTDLVMVADNGKDIWILDQNRPGNTILSSNDNTFQHIRLWTMGMIFGVLFLVWNKGGDLA